MVYFQAIATILPTMTIALVVGFQFFNKLATTPLRGEVLAVFTLICIAAIAVGEAAALIALATGIPTRHEFEWSMISLGIVTYLIGAYPLATLTRETPKTSQPASQSGRSLIAQIVVLLLWAVGCITVVGLVINSVLTS